MFSSEKRNLRETVSVNFLHNEKYSRELKANDLVSHKFLLNRANIFLKKDQNAVFMNDLEIMIDLTQEILSQILGKEQVFQNQEIQNKKGLIDKLINHINEKILKIDKCLTFVKFCKSQKEFAVPEDFIETVPEVDYIEAACHQFRQRIENCIEAKAFDYINQAFQLFIVMFRDHFLIDCFQKEHVKEGHPDLLSLLIICLVIRNGGRNELEFGEEAYNSLIYIINRISHVDTVQVALQFYQVYKPDRSDYCQDHDELAIKILTWAEHANNLVKLERSDDTGSVLVQLDFEPEVNCTDVDRYMYDEYSEAVGMWKVYFSPSFILQSISCLPQSLKMRLSKENQSNEHQTSYLREGAETILEWAYNLARDKVIPRLYDRVIPWTDYYEKHQELIERGLLPSIEAELLYALTPKESQFQFLKLGLISNLIQIKCEVTMFKIFSENFMLIKERKEKLMNSLDCFEICKKLVQNSVDISSLQSENQVEELIQNKFLAAKYWKLFSICLKQSEKIHSFGLNHHAINLLQLDDKNEDQKIKSYLLDLFHQVNYLKCEGNTFQELKVKQSDQIDEVKEHFTKKVDISLYLLANSEFQNSIWFVVIEFYKKLSIFYKLTEEDLKKKEFQKIKNSQLDIEQIVHQYLVKDPIDLQSGNIVSFKHQDVVQAIFQYFFNPTKIVDDVPTYKLKDENLLKELTKSHGESPYYEGVEELINHYQYSKFLNKMGNATEFSLNFVLNVPIKIFGYGIRSANDCPGRDPRKWSIKFKLPQTESTAESEPQYEVVNQETTWNDRYQLKDFFFEKPYVTDLVIFTFSLDYEGFDRVASSEYSGEPTVQMSEIRFHSEQLLTSELDELNFKKITNCTIQSLKNLKRTYSLQGISPQTQLYNLEKTQNLINIIKLLFNKIKDHLQDNNQKFACFKEATTEVFSQEIFEIFTQKEEIEEVQLLKSKVFEWYQELFLTFMKLMPDFKQNFIQQGSLQILLQVLKEQSSPIYSTLQSIQSLLSEFNNEKALDLINESGLLQKYLMPASEDRIKGIVLASNKIEYDQFYKIIKSHVKEQPVELSVEPNPSKILEDEKMILLKNEIRKKYGIHSQMEVILELSSELNQNITHLRQSFLNKAKDYALSIVILKSEAGEQFGFFVPDVWEDTIVGKPSLYRDFYYSYEDSKEVSNGIPFAFLFNQGQIQICEWMHNQKAIMWSREDEFLGICMGIALKGYRPTDDTAYLDPLCWKLPDYQHKTVYVHRDKSLSFCNQDSYSFKTKSVEVFGFNGNQLTNIEVEAAFIAIIDYVTPKLRNLQKKFYKYLDTFFKEQNQQVSNQHASAFPETKSFQRFLFEVTEQITDSEDYYLIIKELPKLFSCVNERSSLYQVLKKLFIEEADSTKPCYFTKFLEIYAMLCTLSPVLKKLDDLSQSPFILNQLQDVIMIFVNLDQSSKNPVTSTKFLNFVSSQISSLKEIIVQVAKQVESYATDRLYFFHQDYQPTNQKQVSELKEVNWIDLFSKMNSCQNKIEIQHKSQNITDEIDLDNIRGHLIAQINITMTMFEQFTQNTSKIGKKVLQQTKVLYAYIQDVRGLEISFIRTQNLTQSLIYFNYEYLAQHNYVQDLIKYRKLNQEEESMAGGREYDFSSDFRPNIETLMNDLLFFQDNQKLIDCQLESLEKSVIQQAESDKKDVEYIQLNRSFFKFHDFDQSDLLNEMSKIKEKEINSPDYQVFMKNIALILETYEVSINNAFDDKIQFLQFVQDNHMSNLLQIFTFIKKSGTEPANLEIYKSYMHVVNKLQSKIYRLQEITDSFIDKDLITKHNFYKSQQEFFCNYFYNLIAGVLYQDGFIQVKTSEEKENSFLWLNQILVSEIQQFDRNLNENQTIQEIQKSFLNKIATSFGSFSHLKSIENNEEPKPQEQIPEDNKKSALDENLISQITDMGFERKYARKLLRLKGDLESAINFLLEGDVSKLDNVSDDEQDKQSEDKTLETQDQKKEKCKLLLQKLIKDKLLKEVKQKEKELKRESLISIQEFYKFFDKTQFIYYQFTSKWYQESKESEEKKKHKVLQDNYLDNCRECNIFPKTYGQRQMFLQIYSQNWDLFTSKLSQIQELALFGGDKQDMQQQITLLNEISQQFNSMFNLLNYDSFSHFLKTIKNQEDNNYQSFQNQVFKLFESLLTGKQNMQPKEFLMSQTQMLMDKEEKHKSFFLNKSLSLIFRCLQMYRVFQQKYVLKFEKVESSYKVLVSKPQDDQQNIVESQYKAKGYSYFSKIQLLNNKGLCEKVHTYILACRSQINLLNLSTESFDECKNLLLQLNDASQFVQVLSDHILSNLRQSSLLSNQNILIMPSRFSQNISLDLESEESGPTPQQTSSIGTLQIARMLNYINNDRLAEQFAFLMKKCLTLKAKKQAMYNLQQANEPVKNIKEIQITQLDSKVEVCKFINDFRKNYLGIEKDDYYAYKSNPISDESARYFSETMYKAIPLVCQVQIPTNKYEGEIDNSFLMLKKEIIDQVNNQNQSNVEIENYYEIKLYENLMGQMVKSGQFLLKKIEKSWTEDVSQFDNIYNWSQMTILALRTLSCIARTSFDGKSGLMTRIENDFKENNKLSLLSWFKNVYLPIRLLGTHTFKVSSSTDPENTETTDVSVFMTADYNDNLDKNIYFFLNELLGYGHAYSELAILQRKTLRQQLLQSCLETLQKNLEKTDQSLGNGYLSMPVLEQSQQIGSMMIIQHLINQYNFFEYNRSIFSRTCYQETIDSLFEWQSTNKTDSTHLIYGLQEQVQWLTQLPYVKEETSVPGKQNKLELLRKLKYITTQGFASQLLDRITQILSNLQYYKFQLTDRQKKLQGSNKKIDLIQVKEQQIEGPEEHKEQIILQMNNDQQQSTVKVDQRTQQNIPAQQNTSTDQNNILDNNLQHNEDEGLVQYQGQQDFENIESQHLKQYSPYDDNDGMDGTNDLEKGVYPKHVVSNIDNGSLSMTSQNQCYNIEQHFMHYYTSWTSNGDSRTSQNFQDIITKQTKFEINEWENVILCPLIQILKPLSTQNYYDLGQIIEDKFFQVLAKIEIREISLEDNPEEQDYEVKQRREYRSYGNDQNESKDYFTNFQSYVQYIDNDYYRINCLAPWFNSWKNLIKHQGITGLGFRNFFDVKDWKPQSSDQNTENTTLDDSFSSEIVQKPQVTYNNNDKIKEFIQNLFNNGQLSFETVQKEPEPVEAQEEQIVESKEENVSSEAQSTPDTNLQDPAVFNLEKSTEQTSEQIAEPEQNEISKLEQVEASIPVARINGLIYIQANKLGLASYYLLEPGLVEEISPESEFPKNIVEDQEFPEFQSLPKKQSGSYISYSTAPDNWTTDDGQRFPQKKFFLETHYDSEKRMFTGWIDWTETPINEGDVSFQYLMEFSEDFETIQSGYCVTRDINGKVKETHKFGESLSYSLYKEPEPVAPKEPENLDQGQLITSVRDPQLRRELLLELSKEEVAKLPQELKDELQRILGSQNNAESAQVTEVIIQNLSDPSSQESHLLLFENLRDLDQQNEDEAIQRKEGLNILEKVSILNTGKNGEIYIKNILQNMIFQEFRNFSTKVFYNISKQKFNPEEPSDFKLKMINEIIILIEAVQEMDFAKFSQFFSLSSQQQEALQSKIKTEFWTKSFVKLNYVIAIFIKEDEMLAQEIIKQFISPDQSDGNIMKSTFQNLMKFLTQNLEKLREQEQKSEADRNEELFKSYGINTASIRIVLRHLFNQLNKKDKDQNLEIGLKDSNLQKKAKEMQEQNDYKLVSSHELFGQEKLEYMIDLMNLPNLKDQKMGLALVKFLSKTTQFNLIDLYLFDTIKEIKLDQNIENQDLKIDLNIPTERQELYTTFKQASNQTASNCLKNFSSIISGQKDNLQESVAQVQDLAFNINELIGCKDIPRLRTFYSGDLEKPKSIKDLMQKQLKIMVDVKKIEITKEFNSDEGQQLKDLVAKFKVQSAQIIFSLSCLNQTIRQLAQTKSTYLKAQTHFIKQIQEKEEQDEDQKVLGFLNLAIKLLTLQINSVHALFIDDNVEDFIDSASQFLLSTQKINSERDTLDDYTKQLYIIVFEFFYPEMFLEVINIEQKASSNDKEYVKMQKIERIQAEVTKKQENSWNDLAMLRRTSNQKKATQKFDLLFKDEIKAPSKRLQLFNTFCTQNKFLLNKYLMKNIEYSGYHDELKDVYKIMSYMPKLLSWENKKAQFDQKVAAIRPSDSFNPEVVRPDLFETAFDKFYNATPEQLKYVYFRMYIQDEPGIDAGGVRRDFFNSISKSIFNEDIGFFSHSDNNTYMPNPRSVVQLDYEKYFRFIGRIIAKAIMEKCMLECYFTPSVYKMILGQTLTFKDLQDIDDNLYLGLYWCLLPKNDVELLYETFSIEQDYFGNNQLIEFIPGGSEIDLTNENKEQFVESKAYYILYLQIKKQMDAFLEGFYDVIPQDLIKVFNHKELEIIISGQPHVDIADLKANTDYSSYDSNSQQIIWFWEVMESLNEFDKASFLQFVTGCSKVPAGGFAMLFGMGSLRKFCISKDYSSPEYNLPQAHTCYNQLDLPEYKTKETLQAKLTMAIKEAGGFGFG